MIWYLLYPIRRTTEAPALSPSNPFCLVFTRYGNYIAHHVVFALLISGIVATILIYPIPYLFTDDFTNGASNLPHHVWTVARPLGIDAPVAPDIIMRSIWIHGDYMKALNTDVLTSALELQDELLGSTEGFSPVSARGTLPPNDNRWPMDAKQRDASHIVNGLTNQSWFFHSPLLYWNCSRRQIRTDPDLITTVNEKKTQSTSANVTLRHSIVFSGKKFAERRLLAADALVITLLHLRDSPVGYQWEYTAPLLAKKASAKWDIYPQSGKVDESQLYEFQFRPISLYDIISLTLAYGLTLIYFLASLSKLRAIKSKAGLTVTVITQIAFSIMSSFTVCAIFDIDLSRIPRAAYPLVILAISLENMFRIIYAVILSPSDNSSGSRVGAAFGQTAHIALASTVQNVVILVGLSRIVSPGVAGFCIFAAIATIFDFFYLSTFFLSVLSVDVRRVELEDELSRVRTMRHDHTLGERQDHRLWVSNIVKGKVTLSTRVAGTVVMVAFVSIAQWHFFGDIGIFDIARRLVGASQWTTAAALNTASQLDEIHQARSPGSWLRLQDHETAQEVINAIKPSAYSYIAKVYDPLVFVLKDSDRTPPQQKQRLLPAAYDFIDHQLAQFVISILLVGAGLRLLASYLLWADEGACERKLESNQGSPLSIKTLPRGHSLDVMMLTASADGHIVSAGLDRIIRVWHIRSSGLSYELPGTKVFDGRGIFPILAMTIDSNARWLAVMSTAQLRVWNMEDYVWDEPMPIESASHKPEVFCFHPDSTQQKQRLVIVRKDGTLMDMTTGRDGHRIESLACEGQLLMARPLTLKYDTNVQSLLILSLSRNGQAYIAREKVSSWEYESLPLNTVSDATLHQIVPLSPHPFFLIGSAGSVYLISANDGAVQHIFTTETMIPRSLQCEYSYHRHSGNDAVSFNNFTIAYTEVTTQDLVVVDYSSAEGTEAIAACAPSGGAGAGWCTWEEALVGTKRVQDPGSWEVVKGRSIIGIRELMTKRDNKHINNRKRSVAKGGAMKATAKWQAWTTATDRRPELGDAQKLFKDESDAGEPLVVPGLGPKAKIGVKSVAFCVGNVIKVISAGGQEYTGDDDSGREPLLSKDGRCGRHGGSTRGRS